MKSTPSIWHLLHNVKLTVKILSIFVAFLENMNFQNSKFLSNRFECNATTAREVYESLFVCLEARPIVYFLSVILRSRVAQLMKKLHLTFLSSL